MSSHLVGSPVLQRASLVFEQFRNTSSGDLHIRRFSCDADSREFAELEPFHAIWQAKCRAAEPPRWCDFAFADFLGWHRYMALSDIQPGDGDLRFRIFGSGVVELMGDDLTGRLLTQSVPTAVDDGVIEHFRRIRDEKLIGFLVGQVGQARRAHRRFKVIELPLAGGDDGKVAQILHGFVTNVFEPGWP